LAGYAVSIVLGFVGLARRGLLKSAWALALMMVHWVLLSAAAWRALLQLAYDPHGWEKTAHGLGKTSRHARLSSVATLDAVFRRKPVRARASDAASRAPRTGVARRPQTGALTTASNAARSGASSEVSRSSRATIPIVTLGSSGSTPGASTTSGGGRMRPGMDR